MVEKKSKDEAKVEALRACFPFRDVERLWSDEFLREPFPLLAPAWWRGLRSPDRKEIIPAVDISDEGDDLLIKAELPGVKREDIDTTVAGHVLTISGEKRRDDEVEGKRYYWIERSYGSLTRSFHLPVEVEVEQATAKFENGVLEIRIPKTEEAKKKEKKVPIE